MAVTVRDLESTAEAVLAEVSSAEIRGVRQRDGGPATAKLAEARAEAAQDTAKSSTVLTGVCRWRLRRWWWYAK